MQRTSHEEELQELLENFQRTTHRSLQEFIEKQVYEDPFRAFDSWPLRDIREQCVRAMVNQTYHPGSWYATWTRRRIRDLMSVGDNLWEELLQWALFGAYGDEEDSVATLELAIDLAREYPQNLSKISKRVSGKLLDFPNFYWKVPSIGWFMDTLLKEIDPDRLKKKMRERDSLIDLRRTIQLHGYQYNDEDWHNVRRAIDVIVEVRDVRFLPYLGTLLVLHRKGTIRLASLRRFDAVQHRAVIGAAVRILRQPHKQSQ